jgi:hypothetical protein
MIDMWFSANGSWLLGSMGGMIGTTAVGGLQLPKVLKNMI